MSSSDNIRPEIPYGRQSLDQDDIDAVVKVLRSGLITQGPEIDLFENALCNYTGARYASVCSSGTSALHLAMLALEVSDGDLVWTVPNTFVATANAAIYCGAQIEFLDISLQTFNLDMGLLEAKLAVAKKQGRLPKVIVPVHFAGNPADLAALMALKEIYGFYIVEDACHALGATYGRSVIGDCAYADIAAFSFHPVKSIAAGEGGALLTNNPQFDQKIKLLRHHGITKNTNQFENAADGPWYYEQRELGYNYRMSSLHAALGMSQLRKINQFINRRNEIASLYRTELKSEPLVFQDVDDACKCAYHLVTVLLPDSQTRLALYNYLHANNMLTQVHYIPVNRQPFYQKRIGEQPKLPNTDSYYDRCLSLPVFFDMTNEDVSRVVSSIQRFFTKR